MKQRNGRVGLWIAGGVVAIAVVVGVVGLTLPRASTPDPTDTGTPSTAPTSAGGCSSIANDSTAVPTDLRWTASAGVTWPVSDSLGPTSVDAGFPDCFARSPIGAALAAVTSVYSVVDHDPIEAFDFYTVDSPSKAKVIEEAKALSGDQPDLARQLSENGMALVGFQIREYDSSRAAVSLVYSMASSSTGFRTIPRTMVWANGDWRAKLDDTGSFGESVDIDFGSFIRWSN